MSATAKPSTLPTIALIGLRASGKTTVGRLLATALDRTFADLDDLTAAALGEPTAGSALALHGQGAFRAAEAKALEQALGKSSHVLALGGGTPTAPGAAERLRQAQAAGRVRIVYLVADAATLRARLAGDRTQRPSLTGRGTLDEVEDLLRQRDPVYRSLADVTIDAGCGSTEQVTERILRAITAP